jgi:hypothetical protein
MEGKIVLKTPNDDGLFETYGKKKVLNWEGIHILNTATGEVISEDIRPKFSNWMYEDYRNAYKEAIANGKIPPVRFLPPMLAYDPDQFEEIATEIAELKHDGHLCKLYIGENCNRAFSRRVSDITGWFSENTDQIPHIRDLKLPEFEGTVLVGELCWGEKAKDVSGITGALPQTAIQNQFLKGWATLYVFDIIYYNGISIRKMPLYRRKSFIHDIVYTIQDKHDFPHIEMTKLYISDQAFPIVDSLVDTTNPYIVRCSDYLTFFKSVVEMGYEGIMLKDIHGRYELDKKSKNNKRMKKKNTWDVVFMGTSEPTKEYTGKLIEQGRLNEWRFWLNPKSNTIMEMNEGEKASKYMIQEYIPVTKPYAMGWCGGIIFGVWKPADKKEVLGGYKLKPHLKKQINGKLHILTEVGVAKGLSEDLMIDIKKNAEAYSATNRVLSIQAQEIIDPLKGSLRHPEFYEWRDDKNDFECTWDNHIKKKE